MCLTMCVCAFSSGKIFCKAHCSKSEERFYFFYFYKVARQIFDTGRAMESVIRRGSLVSISIKKIYEIGTYLVLAWNS